MRSDSPGRTVFEKKFSVNAKGHSGFAQDLERLHRRIQENKKTLHESNIKAQNLNASLKRLLGPEKASASGKNPANKTI